MTGKLLFEQTLERQYQKLFETKEYEYAKSKTTPENLARTMTKALDEGHGNKDGNGIKNTCKILGIPYTYKAIRDFLKTE